MLYHSCFSPLCQFFPHPCRKLSCTGQVSIRSGGSKVNTSVSLRIPFQRELTMAAKPDPYEGIDFDEICEATGLAVDEIKCLKVFHIFFMKGDLGLMAFGHWNLDLRILQVLRILMPRCALTCLTRRSRSSSQQTTLVRS